MPAAREPRPAVPPGPVLRRRLLLRILAAGYLGWIALTAALASSWRWWIASAGLLAFVHAVFWFLELKGTPHAEGD